MMNQGVMNSTETYSYSAMPHAAPGIKKKNKYRQDDDEESVPQNIMYDSRVVRGSTYAAKTITITSKKASPTRKNKRPIAMKLNQTERSTTPPPVDGRCHMDIQTDEYLEVIADRPPEADASTQTNPYMDRPPSPLFIRTKTGNDIGTQIEDDDLWDFDVEVEPLLEVIVGKTLHLSMLEIMQEEELEAIREQQAEFENVRNVEIAEVQRLEAHIKRRELEKERRIKQGIARLQKQNELEVSIAARAFSNQYLGELHETVFNMLEEQGLFYDPVKREVEEIFMANLLNDVSGNSSSYETATQMATELLEEARKKAKAFEIEAVKKRKEFLAAEEKRLALEKAEKEAREAAEKAAKEAEAAAEEEA